jgi:PTH1 family peptidyl-tRNA hydrolase
MVIEALMQRFSMGQTKSKYDALLNDGTIDDQKVLLVRPQTYMNLSGESIQKIMAFYKLPLTQLLVVHDDLDLAVGKVRTKVGGGAGGHNGLRSIDKHLGQNYHRIRVGIDHPGQKHLVEKYVLQPFSKDEKDHVAITVEKVAEFFPCLLKEKHDLFMTRVNE